MTLVYASKAEIGKMYMTNNGLPITILSFDIKGRVWVRDELFGHPVKIYGDQLLRPYDKKQLNKEATQMAKAHKKAAGEGKKEKGLRGSDRGARLVKNGIELFRMVGTVEYIAHLNEDGVLTVKGKEVASIKEAAEVIAGKKISGSGRSFFGLRSEPNITIGKQVWKAMKDAQADDEDDEEETKKGSATETRTPVSARSRR